MGTGSAHRWGRSRPLHQGGCGRCEAASRKARPLTQPGIPYMDDVTHRGDFDQAMAARFPKARRKREETNFGWKDSFTVGLLCVRVSVCDRQGVSNRPSEIPFNTIRAEIRAIRTSIDNSRMTIWMQQGGWAVLDDLRAELLGLAHGLLHISGRTKPAPKKPDEGVEELSEFLKTDREARRSVSRKHQVKV